MAKRKLRIAERKSWARKIEWKLSDGELNKWKLHANGKERVLFILITQLLPSIEIEHIAAPGMKGVVKWIYTNTGTLIQMSLSPSESKANAYTHTEDNRINIWKTNQNAVWFSEHIATIRLHDSRAIRHNECLHNMCCTQSYMYVSYIGLNE